MSTVQAGEYDSLTMSMGASPDTLRSYDAIVIIVVTLIDVFKPCFHAGTHGVDAFYVFSAYHRR